MADLHIRNFYVHKSGTFGQGMRPMIFALHEAFDVSDWTIDYKDSDAGWTHGSNVLLEGTDLALAAASPNQVTSATGGFTQSMINKGISIHGNAVNAGIYNVQNVIDTNTLIIDQRNRVKAWSDQTGITFKVWNPSGSVLANNVHVVAGLAAKNFQVEFWTSNGYNFVTRAYPYGDYSTSARETNTLTLDNSSSLYDNRLNMFLADSAASRWYNFWLWYSDTPVGWHGHGFGQLTDIAVGDVTGYIETIADQNNCEAHMTSAKKTLSHTDSLIDAYNLYYKRALNESYSDSREVQILTERLNDGRAKVFRPQVFAYDLVYGKWIRGNHPMDFSHTEWPDNSEFGTTYWRINNHTLIPRESADDIQPLVSATW